MASWMVHLRIADELIPHLKCIDETTFIMGNIAPDSGEPNSDWSEFHPPKSVTHFYKKTDSGTFIDIDKFCNRYFNYDVISGYNLKEFSFFLGYYVHLLTDVEWTKTVFSSLKYDHPKEYAEDKSKLLHVAKEDWYDLDFLYLENHPNFKAFSVYENTIGFSNVFMDIFSKDAFENRRQYITDFYRSENHGNLHRTYQYLTPERVDSFVKNTSKWILEQISDYLTCKKSG